MFKRGNAPPDHVHEALYKVYLDVEGSTRRQMEELRRELEEGVSIEGVEGRWTYKDLRNLTILLGRERRRSPHVSVTYKGVVFDGALLNKLGDEYSRLLNRSQASVEGIRRSFTATRKDFRVPKESGLEMPYAPGFLKFFGGASKNSFSVVLKKIEAERRVLGRLSTRVDEIRGNAVLVTRIEKDLRYYVVQAERLVELPERKTVGEIEVSDHLEILRRLKEKARGRSVPEAIRELASRYGGKLNQIARHIRLEGARHGANPSFSVSLVSVHEWPSSNEPHYLKRL